MKYTVEGLNQEKLCKLELDASDAVLLRWFWDFFPSMNRVIVEGEEYGWISYSHLIADLPILGITSKDVVGRRLKKYVECGLMKSKTVAVSGGGSKAYFRVTPLWSELTRHDSKVGSADPTQKSGDPSSSDPSTIPPLSPQGGAPTRSTVSRARVQVEFNFETGLFRNISDEQVEAWGAAYPALEIETELAKASAWLKANPAKRKKNYHRFIVNWLSRAQERGGDRVGRRR